MQMHTGEIRAASELTEKERADPNWIDLPSWLTPGQLRELQRLGCARTRRRALHKMREIHQRVVQAQASAALRADSKSGKAALYFAKKLDGLQLDYQRILGQAPDALPSPDDALRLLNELAEAVEHAISKEDFPA